MCRDSFHYLKSLLVSYYPHPLPPGCLPLLDQLATRFDGGPFEYGMALLEVAGSMDDAHSYVNPKVIAPFFAGFFANADGVVTQSINPQVPVGARILFKDGKSLLEQQTLHRGFCRGSGTKAKEWAYINDFLSSSVARTMRLALRREGAVRSETVVVWCTYFAYNMARDQVAYYVKDRCLYMNPEAHLTEDDVLVHIPALLKNSPSVKTVQVDLRQYPQSPMAWRRFFQELNCTGKDVETLLYYALTPWKKNKKDKRAKMRQSVPPCTDGALYRQITTCVVVKGLESPSHSEQFIMIVQSLVPATKRKLVLEGSRTWGANGNITMVDMPGGFYINVNFDYATYLDGRPMQRVGI